MPRIASFTSSRITGIVTNIPAPSITPTYNSLTLDNTAYNEGATIIATLNTANIPNGTTVGYTVTGMSFGDLTSGATTGTFTVNSNVAFREFVLNNDGLTEGADTFTITLAATDSAGNSTGSLSDSAIINDTSNDPSTSLWLDDNDAPTTVRLVIGSTSMQINGTFNSNPTVERTIEGRSSGTRTTLLAITARTSTYIEVDDSGNSTGFIPGEQLNLVAPSLGDVYEGGFYIGNTSVGAQTYRLIVAPSNTEVSLRLKTSQTFTAGVTSLQDGFANTESMNNADHPAAQYVRSLTTGGFTDWYLPAYNEYVFLINPNHASLPLAQRFSNRFYWGSYTDSIDQGRIFNPTVPSAGNTTKNNTGIWVRAVRRVPI